MRGGEVSSGVILSSERVTYPLVDAPDMLIAISQEGCDKYSGDIKPDGTLIYDSDLVHPNLGGRAVKSFCAPFNSIAMNDFKNRAVMNMIMLGFVNDVLGLVRFESLKKAMAEAIHPKFLSLNYTAFLKGIELKREWVRA